MTLRRVAEAHDFRRFHSFDMSAFVGDNAIGFTADRAFTQNRDDRVKWMRESIGSSFNAFKNGWRRSPDKTPPGFADTAKPGRIAQKR